MTNGRALTFEALESRRLLAAWDGGGAAGSCTSVTAEKRNPFSPPGT